MSIQNVPVQAKADATGKATFTFPPVTRGQWWHVAGIVPTAPTGAVLQLFVNGGARFKWLGPLPGAAVVVSGGSTVSIKATGLTKTTDYTALLTGSWNAGEPRGVPPQGPAAFTKVTAKTTTIKVLYPTLPTTPRHMISRKVLLKGLTVPTDRVKILGPLTPETLKVGIALTWWPTNKGKVVYYAAGGTTQGVSTNADWISATTSFKFFPFAGLTTFEVLGTTGDYVGVTWL